MESPGGQRRTRMIIGLVLAAVVAIALVWFAATHTETEEGGGMLGFQTAGPDTWAAAIDPA